jgi:hypothetical protein
MREAQWELFLFVDDEQRIGSRLFVDRSHSRAIGRIGNLGSVAIVPE